MPKRVKFESFKYQFLLGAQRCNYKPTLPEQPSWEYFIEKLDFRSEKGTVCINWDVTQPGSMVFSLDDPHFFVRGDGEPVARLSGYGSTGDPVKLTNEAHFNQIVMRLALRAGYETSDLKSSGDRGRLAKELVFHDSWADNEDVEGIDVRLTNEACTAPEMRYITQRLGDIRGKRILDVGCGLGEASVYFALLGAQVTASDLSKGMLNATCRLAQTNFVCVTPHLASVEDLNLPPDALFDVIYAGNLLHHVDIDQTLSAIKPHLAPDGVLVTWDPLAYNPVVNVYRAIATEVRTSDEHPLKWSDLQLFNKHFRKVDTQYFWLSTLIIFVIMALIQRRDPNKERFWKVILREECKWRWLYNPLEKLDRLLLLFFPPLRLLCWNVVVISKI
jgi:SAM-dependent methyltransferase